MTRYWLRLSVMVLVCSEAAMASAQTGIPTAEGPDTGRQEVAAAPASNPVSADSRAQYPAFLSDSYVGFNVGSIHYPFSGRQLAPGFRFGSVDIPSAAVRVVLFGHRFHEYLSAQFSYSRPVEWVKYQGLNGDEASHSVRIAMGDISLKSQYRLASRLALYGEAGLATVSRAGFEVNGSPVVADTHYFAPLVGVGVEYSMNPRWDVVAGAAYVPKSNQRQLALGSMGFRYNMRRLSPEQLREAQEGGFFFPENLIHLSLVTNVLGYGWNKAVSGKVPVFWGGETQIAHGFTVRYQRNVFHSRSRLALDGGVSVSILESDAAGDNFVAISAYPLVRWIFLRTTAADLFVSYSVAGPTYVSKRIIDSDDIGGHFTFQDVLGFGMFVSKRRNIVIQLDISHYSNGNIGFTNPGLMVPTTITLGYGF